MENSINQGFTPDAKVFLDNEYGVVLNDHRDGFYGMIRWDTAEEFDTEDWIGLFGAFEDAGGRVVEKHQFKYINDDGSLKR